MITKWRRQFETIKNEAQTLIIDHYIFKEVKTIIANNPTAKKGSSFHSWLGRLYSSAALIGIRRLTSRRRGDVSLWNLLEDIKERNQFISRDRHVALWLEAYSNEESWLGVANRDFDRLSGEGTDCLSKGAIKRDLAELKKVTETIKEFATGRVAHYSPKEPAAAPTYGHLESAFECLEKLVIKYGILLNGSTAPLLPTWQYDWKAIFRAPWLPKLKTKEQD